MPLVDRRATLGMRCGWQCRDQRPAALLARWLPGGRREGREYLARNPKRGDRTARLDSRSHLTTGRWADFATGDRGSDVVSLAAYMFELSQAEAALRIACMLGMGAKPMYADEAVRARSTQMQVRTGPPTGAMIDQWSADRAGAGRCASAHEEHHRESTAPTDCVPARGGVDHRPRRAAAPTDRAL